MGNLIFALSNFDMIFEPRSLIKKLWRCYEPGVAPFNSVSWINDLAVRGALNTEKLFPSPLEQDSYTLLPTGSLPNNKTIKLASSFPPLGHFWNPKSDDDFPTTMFVLLDLMAAGLLMLLVNRKNRGRALRLIGKLVPSETIKYGIDIMLPTRAARDRLMRRELYDVGTFHEAAKRIGVKWPDLPRADIVKFIFSYIFEKDDLEFKREDAQKLFEWTTEENQKKLTVQQILTIAEEAMEEQPLPRRKHEKILRKIKLSLFGAASKTQSMEAPPSNFQSESKVEALEKAHSKIYSEVFKNVLDHIIDYSEISQNKSEIRIEIGNDVLVINEPEFDSFLHKAGRIIGMIKRGEEFSEADIDFLENLKTKYPVIRKLVDLATHNTASELEAARRANDLNKLSTIDDKLGRSLRSVLEKLGKESSISYAGLIILDEGGKEWRLDIKWNPNNGRTEFISATSEANRYIGPYSFERGIVYTIRLENGGEVIEDKNAFVVTDRRGKNLRFYITSMDRENIRKLATYVATDPVLKKSELGAAILRRFNDLQVISTMLDPKFIPEEGSPKDKIRQKAELLKRQNWINRFNYELRTIIEDYRQYSILHPKKAVDKLGDALASLRKNHSSYLNIPRYRQLVVLLDALKTHVIANNKAGYREANAQIWELLIKQAGIGQLKGRYAINIGCLKSYVRVLAALTKEKLYEYTKKRARVPADIRLLIFTSSLSRGDVEPTLGKVKTLIKEGSYEKALLGLEQLMGVKLDAKELMDVLVKSARCCLELKRIPQAESYLLELRRLSIFWEEDLPKEALLMEKKISEYWSTVSPRPKKLEDEISEITKDIDLRIRAEKRSEDPKAKAESSPSVEPVTPLERFLWKMKKARKTAGKIWLRVSRPFNNTAKIAEITKTQEMLRQLESAERPRVEVAGKKRQPIGRATVAVTSKARERPVRLDRTPKYQAEVMRDNQMVRRFVSDFKTAATPEAQKLAFDSLVEVLARKMGHENKTYISKVRVIQALQINGTILDTPLKKSLEQADIPKKDIDWLTSRTGEFRRTWRDLYKDKDHRKERKRATLRGK